MSDEDDVVIVDASGTEHRFPSGFDPKKAGGIVRYRTQAHPPSAEDFMTPEQIQNRDMTAGDVVKGFGKRAASSLAGIGEMAANVGLIPGVSPSPEPFNPVFRNPLFTRAEQATTPTNDAQRLGGRMELAAEVAGPAISAVKAAPALGRAAVSAVKGLPSAVRVGGPVLVDVATGNYIRAGRRLLGAALEKGGKFAEELPKVAEELKQPPVFTGTPATPPPVIGAPGGFSMPPAGPPRGPVPPPPGRVVAPAPRLTAEEQIAASLAEAGPPAMPPVELPPPAALPPGYTPRATVPPQARPAPVRPAAVTPAPAEAPPAPSLRDQLQASLSEPSRAPAKAVRAAAPVAEDPPTTQPARRAYFLRSKDEIAAAKVRPTSPDPSGSLTVEDLPASWQPRVGQDLFPQTGPEAAEMTSALREEIQARGLTVGQAIAAVSKNKDIPTALRHQMVRALAGSGGR